MSECENQWLACTITGIFAGVIFTGLAAYGVRYIYKKCRKPTYISASVEVVVSPFAGAALGVNVLSAQP